MLSTILISVDNDFINKSTYFTINTIVFIINGHITSLNENREEKCKGRLKRQITIIIIICNHFFNNL